MPSIRFRMIDVTQPPSRWLLCIALVAGCIRAPAHFPSQPPLWRDPDRRPFAAQLGVYFSPHDWDRLDKSIFRPVSELLLVRPAGESANVNALDEVPDSSWFENRLGQHVLGADAIAAGPCEGPPLDGTKRWRVVGGKTDGATPGFLIRAPDGHRYLLKVDGLSQGPRATLADVVGSRIYHAVGFRVPCYTIVNFDKSILDLDPKAHAENAVGEPVPLTWLALEGVLGKALRLPDGRYRVAASRYLDGRPLGPWRYHATLDGDRNDVVPHEDRRELRGSRLLAAWTDHVDQREENTLGMWRETAPGVGFVMHHFLDFSDCFGSLWGASVEEARRRSYTYWFAPGDILADLFTFGVIQRPWDRAALGPLGLDLGLYAADDFEPEGWVPRYPNPALSRMTERDAAWMARIIARFDQASIEAVVGAGQAPPLFARELIRVLMGRREQILRRYLARLSPLADPLLREDAGSTWLCVNDLALQNGLAVTPRNYQARSWREAAPRDPELRSLHWLTPTQLCIQLPIGSAQQLSQPEYVLVEVGLAGQAQPGPIRFHLYDRGSGHYMLAGIERLAAASPGESDTP